jgi:hypothetical protein
VLVVEHRQVGGELRHSGGPPEFFHSLQGGVAPESTRPVNDSGVKNCRR